MSMESDTEGDLKSVRDLLKNVHDKSIMDLTENPQNVNTLVEATKQIQDDYWELLMNTREKTEGPDGIKLWNQLSQQIKN